VVGSDDVFGSVELFNGSTQVYPMYFLNAGTYAEKVVNLNGAAAGNYTLASTGSGTLTIAPKILDWSVDSVTVPYGTYPTLGSATLFGTVSVDDVHGIVSLASTTPLSSKMDVGTYTEYASGLGGAKAGNYVIASIGSYGTLTITQPSGFSSVVSQTSSPQNTGQTLPLAPIGTLAAYQFDAGSLVAPNTLNQIATNFTTANSTPATAQTYYIQSGTGATVTADQIRSGSFPPGTYFLESGTGKKVTQADLASGSSAQSAPVNISSGAQFTPSSKPATNTAGDYVYGTYSVGAATYKLLSQVDTYGANQSGSMSSTQRENACLSTVLTMLIEEKTGQQFAISSFTDANGVIHNYQSYVSLHPKGGASLNTSSGNINTAALYSLSDFAAGNVQVPAIIGGSMYGEAHFMLAIGFDQSSKLITALDPLAGTAVKIGSDGKVQQMLDPETGNWAYFNSSTGALTPVNSQTESAITFAHDIGMVTSIKNPGSPTYIQLATGGFSALGYVNVGSPGS
jgi:hypothetical protein